MVCWNYAESYATSTAIGAKTTCLMSGNVSCIHVTFSHVTCHLTYHRGIYNLLHVWDSILQLCDLQSCDLSCDLLQGYLQPASCLGQYPAVIWPPVMWPAYICAVTWLGIVPTCHSEMASKATLYRWAFKTIVSAYKQYFLLIIAQILVIFDLQYSSSAIIFMYDSIRPNVITPK